MIKYAFIMAAAITLSACGFKPVHSASNAVKEPAFKSLQIEMQEPDRLIHKEAGYYLQQHLYDRIGQNSGPHLLKFTPRSGKRIYGLTSNDVASRFDLVFNVTYELVDTKTGKSLYNGTVRSVSTFGSSSDPYALIAAEKNAADQAARDAADRLLLRLASYYNDPDKNERLKEEKREEQRRRKAEELGLDPDDIPSEDPVETIDETP